jgi:hypothetical protein
MRAVDLATLKTGTHCGFCDESSYNVGRYRGVALVSMPVKCFPEYSETIQTLLERSNVSELKWYELSSARMRFAARDVISYTLDYAKCGKLRVDVLTWDTYDNRHSVPKRDDLLNLAKMHYHLLNNVIIRRWGEPGYWTLFPDEQSAIDWDELERILQNRIQQVGGQRKEKNLDDVFFLGLEKISQIQSHECPPVQVADLFAGLGVHSRESIRKHVSFFVVRNRKSCRRISDPTKKRIQEIVEGLSRSDRERCHILDFLFSQSKKNSWGIHLLRTHGLRTTDPTCPINFWHYTPQSDKDKAPTKK